MFLNFVLAGFYCVLFIKFKAQKLLYSTSMRMRRQPIATPSFNSLWVCTLNNTTFLHKMLHLWTPIPCILGAKSVKAKEKCRIQVNSPAIPVPEGLSRPFRPSSAPSGVFHTALCHNWLPCWKNNILFNFTTFILGKINGFYLHKNGSDFQIN